MLRVVLYAEGAGETLGPTSALPAPGRPLEEGMLGGGHVLIRRTLGQARSIPDGEILFESPLRTRGRVARGSDLIDRRTVRQLLTWPDPNLRPDLVVVLVDRDEDKQRKNRLVGHLAGDDAGPPVVV